MHDAANSLLGAEATSGYNSTYFAALASNREMGSTHGIDAALKTHGLDALVLPAEGFTTSPAGTSALSAVSFLPLLTVSISDRRISDRNW